MEAGDHPSTRRVDAAPGGAIGAPATTPIREGTPVHEGQNPRDPIPHHPATSTGLAGAPSDLEGAQTRLDAALEARDCAAAIEAAWTLHWRWLYAFFRSHDMPERQARDCVEDTFGLLVESWESIRLDRFPAWLFAAARYLWLSHRATMHRALSPSHARGDAGRGGESAAETGTGSEEQWVRLLHFVSEMDPVDQVVFQDTFVDRCDPQDTAHRLEAIFRRPFTDEAVQDRRYRVRLEILRFLTRRSP
ncbi:MAG: sigma-70 family RNA polymerase sigma factor [Deltaproteobacteria bacterium]|nr:sigma-70 family RNA polymerase sigma factor [Deltaproteobacteria bacterium]